MYAYYTVNSRFLAFMSCHYGRGDILVMQLFLSSFCSCSNHSAQTTLTSSLCCTSMLSIHCSVFIFQSVVRKHLFMSPKVKCHRTQIFLLVCSNISTNWRKRFSEKPALLNTRVWNCKASKMWKIHVGVVIATQPVFVSYNVNSRLI